MFLLLQPGTSLSSPRGTKALAVNLGIWTFLFPYPLEQVLGYLKSMFSFYEKSSFHLPVKLAGETSKE